MEEKMLDLICENIYADPTFGVIVGRKNAAKEITAHVIEFVEWKDFGDHPFVPWWDIVDTKIERYYTDEIDDKHWSLDELFQYWLDIKLKT